MAYYEGEISPMTSNCNGCSWNNDWRWIIGLAVVGGIFGNGGFGFGGNNNRNCATQADLSAGFNNSAVLSNLNDIILGQATMQNFINQGFAGLNNTITQGFSGVDNAVCTLGYNMQAGFNTLGNQIASCCCDIKTELMQNRYLNEKQTCDIIRASQDNTNAIIGWLTNEKIAGLQAENAGLKAQISNDKQSAYLISQLKEPCPIPSYLVPNPNCCYNYGVYANNGCNGTASVL